jgi:hypothetical protein
MNERKLQQQEDDKIKKSLALSKSIAVGNLQGNYQLEYAKSIFKSEKCSQRGGNNQG